MPIPNGKSMSTIAARESIGLALPLPTDGRGLRPRAPIEDHEREARAHRSSGAGRAVARDFIAGGAKGRALDKRAHPSGLRPSRDADHDERGRGAGGFAPSAAFVTQQLWQADDENAVEDGLQRRTAFLAYRRALGQAIDIIGPANVAGLVV